MTGRRRRLGGASLIGAAALLVAGWSTAAGAFAAGTWTISAGGSAIGQAAVMPAGKTPTVTMLSDAVRIDWPASTLSSGREVAGYVLKRQVVGATDTVDVCTVSAPMRTCHDTPPKSQPVVYMVIATQQSWRGPASPPSQPVTMTAPATVVAAVSAASASPTPSATPAPSATASATPTPSDTPTPSPSPTPSS